MLDRVADVLIRDMFQISEGETVAITVDAGSEMEIAQAFFNKTIECKGLPMLIQIPVARGDSEAGMADWPVTPLTAALLEVDVWIEMNSVVLLYSTIWEQAMDQNKNLRYLILGNSSVKSLDRVLTGYDVPMLGNLLNRVLKMAETTSKVRVTTSSGTDVTYLTDPRHSLDIDDGDFSKPIFGTAPGYVNIVPKVGTMNGRIVFDGLQHTDIVLRDETIEFVMKDGVISEIIGGDEAKLFSAYVSAFDDPNMYKISHHMIGLNPSVRTLVGEMVEDERIWGGSDFGFGHTSPIDMPPHGQVAKSHFDGMMQDTTLYFDDVKIIEDGEVCHPDLVPFAQVLIGQPI